MPTTSFDRTPDGRVTTVAVGELFFSTTDRRGVITDGNSVFQRLAEFSLDELIGAPHNIIRHPDMPAGVFKIMWDRLAAGLPVAAYVKNLSKTGATYWVFAVITPSGGQHVSVRAAPSSPGLWSAAEGLYVKARSLEAAARSTGASRPVAAELGSRAILDGLKAIGFPTYDSFIKVAVPTETTARLALLGERPRPAAWGPLRSLLDGADALNDELKALVDRLDGYQDLATALLTASNEARKTATSLRDSTGVASTLSGSVADKAPVLGKAATGMVLTADETAQVVEAMGIELTRVRHGILDLGYRIGISQLLTDQVIAFAGEIAGAGDAGDGAGRQAASVGILCELLDTEITTLARDVVVVNEGLRAVSEHIVETGDGLHRFQRDMATWRLLVPRYGVSEVLDPVAAPIDRQLSVGYIQMSALRELSILCTALGQPFDPARLRVANQVITEASRRIN